MVSVAIIIFVAFLESGASILSQMPSILLLKSWRRVKRVRKQHLCSYQCSGSGSYVFGPPGSGSGSGSFYHQAKIVRKTLIPAVFFLFLF
jgi:hypothetical protein